MPHVHYPQVISNLKLLAGLSSAEKASAVSEGKIRFVAKGQKIFKAGEAVTRFFIVCSGALQLFKQTSKGSRITTDIVIAGQTIGKQFICSKECDDYLADALALEDSIVVEFPAEWLKKLAAQYTVVAENIMAHLAQQALMKDVEIEHRSTMNAAQQLACYLQRLCDLHRLNPQGFELPYSKTLIASLLGVEPETLSRTFSKLRALGIEVEDMCVSFIEPELQEQHVCQSCTLAYRCSAHLSLIGRNAGSGN